ncbi:hypothetical protein [Candidatus Protochlamydia phocaeensis]|uniref:hypothetical protein n=1 Tax=Candidatus Protochlamydia phocaeensis TaxID=1414722 RepID=UPI00083951B9|nr:hypothetical protein [Candidatus Protochlamydia phocaeensis]
MRIEFDPSSFSSSGIQKEQEVRESLDQLENHQEEYFEKFHLFLNTFDSDLNLEELQLKNAGESLKVLANQVREQIETLKNPLSIQAFKEEYEAQFTDLHSQLADMTEQAVKKAKEDVELKYKELASHLPIPPAAALELQLLIARCKTLIIVSREQLELIRNLRTIDLK